MANKFFIYYSIVTAIQVKLISSSTIALITNNCEMNRLNSRRRGGILASAAKLFLVAVPLRTRLVFEIVAKQ